MDLFLILSNRTHNKKNTVDYFRKGLAKLAKNEYGNAIEFFNKVTDPEQKKELALVQSGIVHLQNERFAHALASFEKVIASTTIAKLRKVTLEQAKKIVARQAAYSAAHPRYTSIPEHKKMYCHPDYTLEFEWLFAQQVDIAKLGYDEKIARIIKLLDFCLKFFTPINNRCGYNVRNGDGKAERVAKIVSH